MTKKKWRTVSVVVRLRCTQDYLEKDLRWAVENILRETHPRWVRQHERKCVGAFHVLASSSLAAAERRKYPASNDVDFIRKSLTEIGARLSRLEDELNRQGS